MIECYSVFQMSWVEKKQTECPVGQTDHSLTVSEVINMLPEEKA